MANLVLIATMRLSDVGEWFSSGAYLELVGASVVRVVWIRRKSDSRSRMRKGRS